MTAIAYDIDGTIDEAPYVFQQIMTAQMAKGDQVYVITGISAFTVTPDDVTAKRQYLASLGITSAQYSDLIVLPLDPDGKGGHAAGKAQAITENHVDVLFDNSKANVKAAAAVGCLALLVWNSRTD